MAGRSKRWVLRWTVVPLLGIALLNVSPNAQAEPVRVTGGAAVGDYQRLGLHATGDRGLTISAGGNRFENFYGPAEQCLGGGCLPGDLVTVDMEFSGSDFPGMVSIDGTTFEVGLGTPTVGSLFARFDGEGVLLPPFAGETLISRTAPFSFGGFLGYPANLFRNGETLVGSGTATLQFSWYPTFGEWELYSSRYEFSPVPEPASLLLLGTGVGGLVVRRRWAKLAK